MDDINRARDALNHIDAGLPREDWVRAGMSAKSAGLGFDDFHNWSAQAGNYAGENECRTVWKSFDDSGAVKSATLFGMAFAQGWKDPSKSRAKISRPLPLAASKQTPQTPAKQAANATAIWERCIPATRAEAYIDRKKGRPDGLRVYPASAEPLVIRGQNVAGYLVVPCWDGEKLQTLQFIPKDKGDKLNLPGASFGDGSFVVGQITDRVYIVEGIGQAWAVNQASGDAAVVCFGAGRMATVAKVLRAKYPATALVIVPDKGKEEQAAKIAADVSGQWVAMPTDKPSNYDCNDLMQELGAGALAALLERCQAPAMRYKLLSDDDLCKLPPLQWRIKKVLPQTGLAAIYGASGSGKSFLVLDGLQALAAGREWFGYKTKSCNVLYCALEGEGGIAGRVAAYRIRHGATAQNISYLVQPFSLLDGEDITDLAQAIKAAGQGADVVVLDTLNRAAPGADENDSKSMGQIIAASKQLQTLIGGLVLLVHHTGKDASKGLRGHSSLHAALDAAIEVRRDGDRREWLIAKSKDGEDGDAHPFKLVIVPVGHDDEGDEITSCVIEPDESAEAIQKAKRPTLRSNQRIANEAIGEALRKSPHSGKEGAPTGRPCIQYADAVAIVAERIPADAKHKTSRAKTAITGLVERDYLAMKGDWLWDK